jgi:hypothetical protein
LPQGIFYASQGIFSASQGIRRENRPSRLTGAKYSDMIDVIYYASAESQPAPAANGAVLRERGGKRLIRPFTARRMHRKEVRSYEKENPDL